VYGKDYVMNSMLPDLVAKKLFFLGGRILGEDVEKYLQPLLKSQWYSRQRLQELQWKKIQKLLFHAYNNSPFYHKKFNEYGVKPAEIQSPSDMSRVPILTKDELKNSYIHILAQDRKYKYSIAKSSGSTGQSVKFYKDRNASGHGRAAMYRGHSWYDVDVGAREARLWGVPLTLRGKISSSIGDFLLNRFREKDFQVSPKVFSAFTQMLTRYSPQYLMGYSSLVFEYAKFLEAEKKDLSSLNLKMVKVTAETLFSHQREVIKRVFQCPVVNEYGAAEVGIIAFECPMHGMHISMENVYVEVQKSRCVGMDELLITDLNNYYSPVIRYRLGDLGELAYGDECSCGRGLPLLRKIHGRTSDVVYGKDGSLTHSSIFSYILKDITASNGGIKQYKIFQRNKGELEFHIVKGKRFTSDTIEYLQKKVKEKMGVNMQIQVKYVDSIGREKSGKLRYFVSTL